MAKPKIKVSVKKPFKLDDNTELRRWCIEQAARWPVQHVSGGGVFSHGGGVREIEVDLIGRAERLLKWVTTPAS